MGNSLLPGLLVAADPVFHSLRARAGAYGHTLPLDESRRVQYNNGVSFGCRREMSLNMNLNKFFEMGGLNLWIVAAGNGLNLILQGAVALGSGMLGASGSQWGQVVLMMGTFLGPLLVALLCGRMEGERYQSYALYTLPGALILCLLAVLASPLMGLMLAVVAVLGAINGGRLAEMTGRRHVR